MNKYYEKQAHFFGNKTVDQNSGANLKNMFFANFAAFFLAFYTKSAENDYFDQRLACAAPKCWSKYTTIVPRTDDKY